MHSVSATQRIGHESTISARRSDGTTPLTDYRAPPRHLDSAKCGKHTRYSHPLESLQGAGANGLPCSPIGSEATLIKGSSSQPLHFAVSRLYKSGFNFRPRHNASSNESD